MESFAPFGLRNSTATYQGLLSRASAPLNNDEGARGMPDLTQSMPLPDDDIYNEPDVLLTGLRLGLVINSTCRTETCD